MHGVFTVVTGKSDVEKEVRSPNVPHNKDEVQLPTSSAEMSGSTCNPSTSSSSKGAISEATHRSAAKLDGFMQKLSPSKDLIPETEDGSGYEADSDTESEAEAELPELFNQLFTGDNCFNQYYGNNKLAEHYADVMGFHCPIYKQYTIYLFERILLCCKEINPNKKQKEKLKLDKKATDKRATTNGYRGTRLQLKGRIFMTNVTDVISLVKPGILIVTKLVA